MCAMVCMWRSKKTLQESVLSFHNEGPKDWTQAIRLGHKLLYMLSHPPAEPSTRLCFQGFYHHEQSFNKQHWIDVFKILFLYGVSLLEYRVKECMVPIVLMWVDFFSKGLYQGFPLGFSVDTWIQAHLLPVCSFLFVKLMGVSGILAPLLSAFSLPLQTELLFTMCLGGLNWLYIELPALVSLAPFVSSTKASARATVTN